MTARMHTGDPLVVLDCDFPDPGALRFRDTWYAYASNPYFGDRMGTNVQVAASPDLRTWAHLGDALPALPPWAVPGDTWAPHAIVAADGTILLYFAARLRASGRHALGVAASPDPRGPFVPDPEPLVTHAHGAIDPYVFTDRDGIRYLLWKNDGNACNAASWISLQRLAPDGRAVVGDPHPLITNDQPWEAGVVEAPTLCRHGGRYHLLYSAHCYMNDCYKVGHAEAAALLGPYRKATTPLLASGGVRIGPGGQDVIEANGRHWLLSHGWDPALRYRRMYLDELYLEAG
jgi:beta-xylosidase